MHTLSKLTSLLVLLVGMTGAHATLVSYSITGTVLAGNEFGDANAFNLAAGNTITAYGKFDDSVLAGDGSGTVVFGSGSGNTMTIDVNGTLFTASDDDDYLGGSDPYLAFDPGTVLFDFDFSTTGIPSFNSTFLFFDDFDLLLGQWDTNANITVVPVPAAVWLFGSGLIGLAGVVRRKRNRI